MSAKGSKPACSLEPFTLDWTDFYNTHNLDPNTDLITSSVWTVTGGTQGSDSIQTPKTTVFLSDGVIGGTLAAKNTIEINGGVYRTCATLYLSIT